MFNIVATAEEILVAAIIGDKALPRKGMREWILKSLSFFLCGAGVFLLILSMVRFFEMRYASDLAALISAAIVFGASLLTALASAYCSQKRMWDRSTARNELGKNVHILVRDLCAEFDEPIQENPKTAVLLASLLGFLAARYND